VATFSSVHRVRAINTSHKRDLTKVNHDDYIRGMIERSRREKHSEEFKTLNRREISRMDDKALAIWQTEFTADEPQFRLAEHEWQRRITAQLSRASHIAAWVGVIGTLAGVLFGWWLGSFQHRADSLAQAPTHAAANPAIQQPAGKPNESPTPASPTPVRAPLNPNP